MSLDAERAKARAQQADAVLARGDLWGPLHGLPFTLKDAFATAGLRTTTGSAMLVDQVPEQDCTVAAWLKGAGSLQATSGAFC